MSRGTAYYDLPNGERIELPTTMPDVEEVPGPLCDGKFELPEAVKEMFKWMDETFGTWESDFSSFKIWMKLRKNFNPPVRWEAMQDKRRNPKPLGRNTYLYKARKIKSLARSTHTRVSAVSHWSGKLHTAPGLLGGHRKLKNFRLPLQRNTSRKGKNMKIDVVKIALVAVMIAGIQVNVLYHRIDDLECQRDIYKSRYEDWEGVSKEIAEYADTLRDSLKARDRLDGKLLVEDAGDFLCTAYCTEKREHICGTGTGITSSGAPVEADVTVAADPDVFPFGTVLYIEDVGVRIVQDKGAGIQGKHLDIAVSGSHEDALSWQGYGTHRVWIIQEAAK